MPMDHRPGCPRQESQSLADIPALTREGVRRMAGHPYPPPHEDRQEEHGADDHDVKAGAVSKPLAQDGPRTVGTGLRPGRRRVRSGHRWCRHTRLPATKSDWPKGGRTIRSTRRVTGTATESYADTMREPPTGEVARRTRPFTNQAT